MKTRVMAFLAGLLFFSCSKEKENPDFMTAEVDGQPWKAAVWQSAPDPGGGISILMGKAADSTAIMLDLQDMRAPGTYTFRLGKITPAVLVDFTVTHHASGVELRWTTANATGLQRIELERSIDALNFQVIHSTTAINGPNQQEYSFIDQDTDVLYLRYYYRLRLVDTDGSYAYSSVRAYAPTFNAFYYNGATAFTGFDGQVTIETVDTVQQRISGRFQFDYRVSQAGVKQVRKGRFRITYQ